MEYFLDAHVQKRLHNATPDQVARWFDGFLRPAVSKRCWTINPEIRLELEMHMQTGNRGGLLSLEFGHADMGVGKAERLRCYLKAAGTRITGAGQLEAGWRQRGRS